MRRYKPGKIWDYKRAHIVTNKTCACTLLHGRRIEIDEIKAKLIDATIEEFIMLYKQYQYRHYKQENAKVIFYADGTEDGMFPLLFNDDFFTAFKEDRYYCRANSFRTIKNYLVQEHYPNQLEYRKALYYIESRLGESFREGSKLISLEFFAGKE